MAKPASQTSQVGLIGLAVMGQNLALNIEEKGFPISVFTRTTDKMRRFVAERGAGRKVRGAATLKELVGSLSRPRRILLMVKAGSPVDEMLAGLAPLLEPGDVLLDCGNSHFRDTERRERELVARGVYFLGTGVSGGEHGALRGPSIMPGGDRDAYALVEEMLLAIAARVEGKPCCTYLGRGGAGHFVKMVHNGIEYGNMQSIAEVYALLRDRLRLPTAEIADQFVRWNAGPLGSYLIEITGRVLRQQDPETGQPLVERISDRAEQKGTGRWAAEAALELGVGVPTLDAALLVRTLSGREQERKLASRLLPRAPDLGRASGEETSRLVAWLHDALLASTICSFAQGMALLAAASREHGYGFDLAEIARIWQGGCIIRASVLRPIRESLLRQPMLPNPLLGETVRPLLQASEAGWREVVCLAARAGIPVPGLAASLSWLDAYRQERLPANLIQAQRDFFGAHGYERVDRAGVFHTIWEDG